MDLRRALACLGLVAASAALASAQGARDALRSEFEKRLLVQRVESSQRHLELGLDCRKKGLTHASAKQIVVAQEISRGANDAVSTVHAYLRRLDDGFWKKTASKPSRGELDAYDRRARALEERDLAERVKLALWAFDKGLEEDAHDELVDVLRRRDRPLELDAQGALDLGVARIPARAAARLRAEAIEIDGALELRDDFLRSLPELASIHERADERLCVRSTRSDAEAREVFELAKQALVPLERALGGRPDRRLHVALLADRELYRLYLERAGIGQYRVVRGVADRAANVAVLCTADLEGEELAGLVLHELAHAFDWGVSPWVMPAWYAEGFADSFGGRGTFTWRDGRLETGLTFDRERLARVRERFVPLAELVTLDPIQLWRTDPGRAEDFYAESWALYRFLESGAAGRALAERFRAWEIACRGRALGAVIGDPNATDASAARAEFERRFASDLPALERGLLEWLAAL